MAGGRSDGILNLALGFAAFIKSHEESNILLLTGDLNAGLRPIAQINQKKQEQAEVFEYGFRLGAILLVRILAEK